jgi:hypothetical protein
MLRETRIAAFLNVMEEGIGFPINHFEMRVHMKMEV